MSGARSPGLDRLGDLMRKHNKGRAIYMFPSVEMNAAVFEWLGVPAKSKKAGKAKKTDAARPSRSL